MKLTSNRQVTYDICIDAKTFENRFDPQGVMHTFFSALDSRDADGYVFEATGDADSEGLYSLIEEAEKELRYPIPIRVYGKLMSVRTNEGTRNRVQIERWERL